VSNLRGEGLSWSAAFDCAAASVEWHEGPSGRIVLAAKLFLGGIPPILNRFNNLSWTHHERMAEMSTRVDILSWTHADRSCFGEHEKYTSPRNSGCMPFLVIAAMWRME